jgi:hypothetical protein
MDKKRKSFSKTEIRVISLPIQRTNPPPLAGPAAGRMERANALERLRPTT